MTPLFGLLILQTLLGGFDNLWHHEITERLPTKRAAASELSLHAARELIYACVFVQLAWLEPRGAWVILLAALLGLEIVITLADFVLEDRTRRLPPLERVLHTILAINFGVLLAALAPVLLGWWNQATRLAPVSHGGFSWLLSVFATGTFLWSVRNTIAVLRLRRPPEWVRNPIASRAIPSGRTVLIRGATGFIGGHLVRRLLERGDRIIVLTRDPGHALDRFGPHVRIITTTAEVDEHEHIHAVINLAGAPILGFPWTKSRREKLLASRVDTNRELIGLCARLSRAPRVFVSASAIGYYGIDPGGIDAGDEPLDEQSAPQPVFQSRLCAEWENSADVATGVVNRIVKMRMGLVLGRDGGVLPQLIRPVRWGLGAIIGTGEQWVSWIHIDDLVRLFELALDTPVLQGPVNAVSPAPIRHRQLQSLLGKALRRPIWMRIPAFALRTLLGEMSQLLVDGQRVIPARALALGFTFKHPNVGEALGDLLGDFQEYSAVYYNGECPVCRAEMEHYASVCASARSQLRFIDSTRTPNGLAGYGLRREHLERRVYLRDKHGKVLSGMPAIIALWSRMPRYHWLARAFSLPLLRQTSVAMYDHVIAPSLAWWAKTRARRALKYDQARH